MGGDLDSLQPLNALVEIAIWDHHTHRGAVRPHQFLTKKAVRQDYVLMGTLLV